MRLVLLYKLVSCCKIKLSLVKFICNGPNGVAYLIINKLILEIIKHRIYWAIISYKHFFFFLTCAHKGRRRGEFKLVTSTSLCVVHNRLSYPLRTLQTGLIGCHVSLTIFVFFNEH
jgi:hypothetical protein